MSIGLHGQHQARADGVTVQQHRACAAYPMLAPEMRAGKVELIAEEIGERYAWLRTPCHRPAVHRQGYLMLVHAQPSLELALQQFPALYESTPWLRAFETRWNHGRRPPDLWTCRRPRRPRRFLRRTAHVPRAQPHPAQSASPYRQLQSERCEHRRLVPANPDR